MKDLLLIDGHNLLFRMYFGMPFPFTNSLGKDITATVGFIGALIKTINFCKAENCLVVFDGENSIEDKQIDNREYKANRPDLSTLEDNPFEQLYLIKKCLDYLHISWAETDGFECDDYIAFISNKNLGNNTFILSTDKDFYQIVSPTTKIVNYKGKNSTYIDENFIYEKYQLSTIDFCLYKSLIGDKSDNIKGIVGVGPKTAVKIINSIRELLEVPILDNILFDDSILSTFSTIQDKFIQIFIKNIDLIRKNYNLIKLPTSKYNYPPIKEHYPIDFILLKTFKPLRDIDLITTSKCST